MAAIPGIWPITIRPRQWHGFWPCEFRGTVVVQAGDGCYGLKMKGCGPLAKRRAEWWRWLGWYVLGWPVTRAQWHLWYRWRIRGAMNIGPSAERSFSGWLDGEGRDDA